VTAGGPGAPAAPAAATQRTFRIVISYRRVDTGGDARSLAEALERRFGRENVFLDIETIEPGEPFDQAIDRAVDSSDVLLALVGQHWLTLTDDEGRRRIDDPRDVVRLEVGSALARDVRVVPVLLEEAKMPSEDDLPPELAPFSKRNAVELRATSWHPDVERFIEELAALRREKFRRLGPERGWRRVVRPAVEAAGAVGRAAARRPRAAAVVGLLVAVLLAALVAVLAVGGGDDGGGEDEALHPPLAADETLAFASDGRIMLLAGDAPQPAPLPGSGFRSAPDLTTDGARLAFSQAGNIWTAGPGGANARRLTRDGAGDRAPAWSEDGTLVAFDRPEADDPKRRGIWVVRGDGSEPPVDLQAGSDEVGAAPDWSPNGRSLVYQRRFRIWIMAADGSDQRPLVEGFDRPSLFPAWAPSGSRVAFVLVDAHPCEIALARADGTDVQILEPGRPETCSDVVWSPDGRYLLVPAGEDGLWTIERDGGEATHLLDVEHPASPSWARAPG
jgi:hypothetical protein